MRGSSKSDNLVKKISVDSEDSILQVLKKMDELGMKLLIVNENGAFGSLVSIGDIQRAIIRGTDLNAGVSGILREKITVCFEDQSEDEIKESMIRHRAEFMPVLTKDKKLSRIVFWNDILEGSSKSYQQNLDLPVVIMAGGKGTRLKPLTNIIPKPLIPVGEKPIIEMIIDSFMNSGMRKFFLIVNYKASMIESYINELPARESEIEIIREDCESGTGGSLSLLRDKISNTFFMTNCDTLLDQDLSEIYRFHRENENELTLVGALKHYPIPYGTVDFIEGGKFVGITEKPELTLTVNSGTYIIEPHLLNEVPDGKFFHITELIEKIRKRNGRVGVFPVSERSWLDIGEWDEFRKTQEFITKKLGK